MHQSRGAEKIYAAIFNKKIDPSILDHFNKIADKIDSHFSEEEVRKYFNCIKSVSDLGALEIAARHTKKLPVLTVKFKTMLYLSETFPENYHYYVNERDNRLAAYFRLIAAASLSFYKFIKGLFLIFFMRL